MGKFSLIYGWHGYIMMVPQIRAKRKWEKENVIDKSIRIYKKTDADIIEHLNNIEIKSFQGYMKELIRKDIQQRQEEKGNE